MPLTAAERQKRYRENLKNRDPEKFLEQKLKNVARIREKRKKISEYTLSEQETIRKQWRDRKKKVRDKPSSALPEMVPSTEHAQIFIRKPLDRSVIYKLKRENNELKEKQEQWKTTLKSYKKKINRCIRKNNDLIQLIKEKNTLIHDLKEKLSPSTMEVNFEEMTPASKTDAYIKENLPEIRPEEKERVKKTLLQHHVMVETMKQSYQSKDMKEKKLLKNIMTKSEILGKYKMRTKLATYLGLKGKIRHTVKKNKSNMLKNQLKDFYERDDVSKMTAGKNETKTQKKHKKQRRYLLGTLRKLHKKYCQEVGKLSFATFKRYRPFYVLPPKTERRETCACKRHENLKLKATLLQSIGLLATKDLDELLAMVVCNLKSKKCCYGECDLCKNKNIDFTMGDKNFNDSISWDEWDLKSHEYKEKKNSDVTKITKKIVKEHKSGSLKNLLDLFQEELQNFKTHSYNIIHQYKEYRRCTKNLDECTVALHIDFSENYACKLSTEIQAMHFGASRQQITLHTGIMYTSKGDQSFASISPVNDHGPDAIWAHLLPVLNMVREKLPYVNGIHFHSDGPTVQYRQKKNFYYFAKITRELGFPFSTWNFFEANHGKGAADGVGGALKRRLDSFVAYGSDVIDAKTAYELLQKAETKIQLFYIPEDAMLKDSPDLVPVPNTMKLHQIINNTDLDNSVLYRNLSCFCQKSRPGFCDCFDVKSANLLKQTVEKKQKTYAPERRVTILADIKNTSDNRAYFDLSKYGPFNLKEVENISPSIDNYSKNKNNPKKRKLVKKKQEPDKKKRKTKHDSSTDEDSYSLHDSSEGECWLSDSEGVDVTVDDQIQELEEKMVEEKEQSSCTELNSAGECMSTTSQHLADIANLTNDSEMTSETQSDLCFKDTVLVRYYQRGSWKYYIGFVEDICIEEGESYYTIHFLKTVKHPMLKFVISKINDRDTVPQNLIVKKIKITQDAKRPKEYFLAADSDMVYF